jgi:transcriptional regulator with XRE-family HTH domain
MSRKKLTVEETFPGLPNRIKFLRGGRTQQEFGEILGVSKATISKYESGIAIPSSDILRKIASIGNKEIEWLLRGDRPLTPQPSEHPQYAYDSGRAPLDVALLSEVLSEIKNFIAGKGLELLPQREARLVALVYDHCQKDRVKPDRNLVERFQWITRVD